MAKEKKSSALMKPVEISDALAAVVGKGPMPRTQITKNVWKYIHENGLQDTNDKRCINPDAKLGKILGSEKINMFQMTKKINEHIKR